MLEVWGSVERCGGVDGVLTRLERMGVDRELLYVEGGRVNLGGKNYGYFKKMLEEGWVDDDLFVPFKAALEEG